LNIFEPRIDYIVSIQILLRRKNMFRKTTTAFTFAVILSLLVVGVAGAITIVVDGIREAAWNGSGGQTPGTVTDPNEAAITDGYDIQTFQWTNDQTNIYFLFETYANTIYTGFPAPTIVICFNTDNNTATGGAYANCNNMTGIDRSVTISAAGVTVFDGIPGGTVLGTGTRATVNTITEVSVSLSLFGFGPGTCPSVIPAAIYFDNGITDPDDNVPDTNPTTVSCGGPTAVTLSSLQAQPTTSPVLPVALVGVSAAALIGVVFLIRRKKTA
jgi:hypothetical protein